MTPRAWFSGLSMSAALWWLLAAGLAQTADLVSAHSERERNPIAAVLLTSSDLAALGAKVALLGLVALAVSQAQRRPLLQGIVLGAAVGAGIIGAVSNGVLS